MEEGGTWEGKKSRGWDKGNKKGRNKERYLPSWMAHGRVSY